MSEYNPTQQQAFLAKVQSVAGTFQSPSTSTDGMPIEAFYPKMNPKTTQNNEVRGTKGTGATIVGGFQPDFSLTAPFRGGGAAATAPRAARLSRAAGFLETTAAILPASGTFVCTAGTVNSVTIDGTTGSGTQLPSTAGALVGRTVVLGVNPAAGATCLCTSYTISGASRIIGLSQDFASTLGVTTTVQLPAGMLYTPLSSQDVFLSAEHYMGGRVKRFSDVRANLKIAIKGGDLVKFTWDCFGTFVSDADVAVPVLDFSSLGPPGIALDGQAFLNGKIVALTSADIDCGIAKSFHENPNVKPGFESTPIQKRNVKGSIVCNMRSKATADVLADLAANTEYRFGLIAQQNGAVGTRFALTAPGVLLLDETIQDNQGTADENFPVQFTENLGDDEIAYFVY